MEKYATDFIREGYISDGVVIAALRLISKGHSLDRLIQDLELSPEQIESLEMKRKLQIALESI